MKLDEFTEAFFVAAWWATTGDNDEPLDNNYALIDIAEPTLLSLIKECKEFQERFLYLIKDNLVGAGHDFFLTREGHGAGFWDGDWPEEAGEILTEASKGYGSVDLYVGDDGKIYRLGREL